MPYLILLTGHFLQKSPTIGGSFAKSDLQLKASYASSTPYIVKSYGPLFTNAANLAAEKKTARLVEQRRVEANRIAC